MFTGMTDCLVLRGHMHRRVGQYMYRQGSKCIDVSEMILLSVITGSVSMSVDRSIPTAKF